MIGLTEKQNIYTVSKMPDLGGIRFFSCSFYILSSSQHSLQFFISQYFLFFVPSSSCLNNGTCIDDINTFSCRCRPGFYGTFCEYEQNECDSQPCKNGGTCTDGLGTYRCTCPVGYNGQNCQVMCLRVTASAQSGSAGNTPELGCICSQHLIFANICFWSISIELTRF